MQIIGGGQSSFHFTFDNVYKLSLKSCIASSSLTPNESLSSSGSCLSRNEIPCFRETRKQSRAHFQDSLVCCVHSAPSSLDTFYRGLPPLPSLDFKEWLSIFFLPWEIQCAVLPLNMDPLRESTMTPTLIRPPPYLPSPTAQSSHCHIRAYTTPLHTTRSERLKPLQL